MLRSHAKLRRHLLALMALTSFFLAYELENTLVSHVAELFNLIGPTLSQQAQEYAGIELVYPSVEACSIPMRHIAYAFIGSQFAPLRDATRRVVQRRSVNRA